MKFTKRKIIIGSAIIAIIAVISVLSAVALSGNSSEMEVKPVDERVGEYIATYVPKDYEFKINIKDGSNESNSNLVVYSINEKKINTENSKSGNVVKIKAPKGGYEEGGIYTLDIGVNAEFKNKEIKNASSLVFVIASDNTSDIEYQKGVVEVSGDNVKVDNETLTIKGNYSEGAVIISNTNSDGSYEVYKLVNVQHEGNTTVADYVEPTAAEVYKQIDFFYSDYIDYEDAKINESEVIDELGDLGVIDAFTDDVYAVSDKHIKVSIEELTHEEFKVKIVLTDPNNNMRKLTMAFGIKNKLLVDKKGRNVFVDNTMTITSGLEFTVEGSNKKETKESILKALENYSGNDSTDSESNYSTSIAYVSIPIVSPVSAYIDLGFDATIEYAAKLNTGADTKVVLNQGLIYDLKKLKTTKKYSSASGEFEANLLVEGELDAFVGVYTQFGVKIPVVMDVGINVKGGPYLKGEGCFAIDGIPNNVKSKGYYRIEAGIRCDANAVLDVALMDEQKWEFASVKKALLKYSDYLKVESSSLLQEYSLSDGRINIGDITINYYDVINKENISDGIGNYSLSIDGNRVTVKGGVIQEKIKAGVHQFKLEWEYEGHKFSRTEKINISNFNPWNHFKNMSVIGKSYGDAENKYGRLISLRDVEFDSIWQNHTNLGGAPEDLYKVSNSEISMEFFNYSKVGYACSKMGGTAKEIFGITSDKDIADLMQKIDVYIGEQKRYSLQCTLDVFSNCWWAYKSDDEVRNIDDHELGYGYMIQIHSEGVQSAYPRYDEDAWNGGFPMTTADTIQEGYGGYDSDYRIVHPNTKVVITLVPYGTGY